MRPYLFNPRAHSLVRGNVLVLASLASAFWLSHFPSDRPSAFLVLPLLIAIVGTADTMRCMKKTWSLYHGGVLLLIYMDLMSTFIILFFFLYPYLPWFAPTR
ncbi:permease [Edaphobacter sp.]|uniref:permease n=1 Tax=Edaphobacter sp. TaxID=1934404 RepID=UPI002DB80408|nr:permease [Edaphobacter sp.]HEU5341673.1 permease [Edaphobacter sp.]